MQPLLLVIHTMSSLHVFTNSAYFNIYAHVLARSLLHLQASCSNDFKQEYKYRKECLDLKL